MTAQQSRTSADATVARLSTVVEGQQREIEQLRTGEVRRRLVHLAQGVLIEQLRCSSTEAAEHLVRLARRAGRGEAELAADLLGQPQPAQDARERARLAVTEAAAQAARDGSELASALLEEVLGELGAVGVALWRLSADGGLELAGHTGFDLLEASRWRRIPPQMDSLPQRAASTGRPLWLPGTADVCVPVFGAATDAARAVIPLAGAKNLVGVLEVAWPSRRREFSAAVRGQLVDLAAVCARVVDFRLAFGESLPRAEAALVGYGLLARPVRDDAGEVIDFEITHVGEHLEDPAGRTPREIVGRRLVHAYPWLGASEVFDHAMEALRTGTSCQLDHVRCTDLSRDAVTPAITHVRVLRFFDGVLIDWRLESDAERLAGLLRNMQRLAQVGGWEHNLMSGETTWTGQTFTLFGLPGTAEPIGPLDLGDYAHPADAGTATVFQHELRHGHDAAATFRILRADGTIRQVRAHGEPVFAETGELIALRGIYQDITTLYQSQVALAATQDRLAHTQDRLADSEQQAQQQHQLARALQKVILPSSVRPLGVEELEIAVRYRPAEQEHRVGGDWYDAVMLPSGRVLLVIGDVAGHGIPAATGMVALRNTLRGLAITGAGPGRLLSWLNTTACHLAQGTTGTVLCGLYEPTTRTLSWSRAGHLPPLLIRDGEARFLPLPDGVLLGALPEAGYEERATELRAGDRLVLYTDGLIERRSILIDDSLDRLARSAARLGEDVERVADELLHHCPADTDDDTCLIVIRVGSPEHQSPAGKNSGQATRSG